jgi:outer membrane protein OmpA-like peptidoglycan-associated protein
MIFGRIAFPWFLALLAAGAVYAQPAPPFKSCPFIGAVPNYDPIEQPQWENWDSRIFHVKEGANEKEITINGAVCSQNYDEKQGQTGGSALEIMMNYKQSLRQQGAEIKWDRSDLVVGHLIKAGMEDWISVSASRDDGYNTTVVIVEPLKRTLTAPSGNDYRLLGHMPGFEAGTPSKKNFAEYNFPIEGGEVVIRGALYDVEYQEPSAPPERRVVMQEILENYRAALRDLHAEFLRENPENITARLDDHGNTVYVFVAANRVVAVEEKPFQLTIAPPTADIIKDKLDKEGHFALHVNFDFAKATLKPDAQPVIAEVVGLLKRNPTLTLSIDGHTDSIGAHDYNVKLSQDRAASVMAAVAAGGIDRGRLSSNGYGPDKPIAPNDTDEGRAMNRRVELVKGR